MIRVGLFQWRTALLVRLGARSGRRPCRRPESGDRRAANEPFLTNSRKIYPHWRSRADQCGSRDKVAALALAERASRAMPVEKDALFGAPRSKSSLEWRREWGTRSRHCYATETTLDAGYGRWP